MVVMLSPWGLLAAIIEPQIYFYFYTLGTCLPIKFYVLNYVVHFYETMGRLNLSPRCMFL